MKFLESLHDIVLLPFAVAFTLVGGLVFLVIGLSYRGEEPPSSFDQQWAED